MGGWSVSRRHSPGIGPGALLPVAVLFLFAAVGSCVGHGAELRVREAAALACARDSDGTDSAIADCYTVRGLALPERI